MSMVLGSFFFICRSPATFGPISFLSHPPKVSRVLGSQFCFLPTCRSEQLLARLLAWSRQWISAILQSQLPSLCLIRPLALRVVFSPLRTSSGSLLPKFAHWFDLIWALAPLPSSLLVWVLWSWAIFWGSQFDPCKFSFFSPVSAFLFFNEITLTAKKKKVGRYES